MFNPVNYKKLSLFVILDAYVTKNAIIDFLKIDNQNEFKEVLINNSDNKAKSLKKIDKYITYLKNELDEINIFLNDDSNIHWEVLGLEKKFFDASLPKYKRKIEWFRSVDRYAFDYRVFFNNSENQFN